ncbi:UNVERIFIED_CONTAM: hypothetical protein Sradi_7279400 [Sesamum radiatum]|uniref:Reverse transcriptase domain-containing protein n=1 Tax=Sesamum radiatum TaxID=300843 RepID=A0AAW2IK35_SESRA
MPLKQTLGKLDTSGRLIKWAVELSEYDISYLPRTTIKAQTLVDFVSKMTGAPPEETSQDEKWLLHIDGSSTTQDNGAGIVITSPQGEDLEFAVKFCFKASNNEAEYEALVEVTNRILVQGIKRRLERVGENSTEELTSVLWAYRTTPRGSTGESPFTLVYGTEAIIPVELGIPSHRIMHSQKITTTSLKENLDLLEELREKAFIHIQRYKNIMINAYN